LILFLCQPEALRRTLRRTLLSLLSSTLLLKLQIADLIQTLQTVQRLPPIQLQFHRQFQPHGFTQILWASLDTSLAAVHIKILGT
jgi:hypothetical protein